MTENCHFQLVFPFSGKFLELQIGYCSLRFYTAENTLGGEHLLKNSGVFHISPSSFQVSDVT